MSAAAHRGQVSDLWTSLFSVIVSFLQRGEKIGSTEKRVIKGKTLDFSSRNNVGIWAQAGAELRGGQSCLHPLTHTHGSRT